MGKQVVAVMLGLLGLQMDLAFDMGTFPERLNRIAQTGVPDAEFSENFRLREHFKFDNEPIDLPFFDGKSAEERLDLTCSLCRVAANDILDWFNAGDPPEVLVNKTVNLCLNLNIQTERVCRGLIESNIDLVYYIMIERNSSTPVDGKEACGFLLYPDCWVDLPRYNWTLDLDFLGPKPTPETPQLPPTNSPKFKVLQLTDVHVDPNYRVGGNAACDEPTCCRFDQGDPINSTGAAGYWGDYRDCDLPVHAFENLIDQASSAHSDIAYVIFTGDIIDHGVWATSTQSNIDLITYVYNALKARFTVPVFPIFGNHEAHPMNVFTSDEMNVPVDLSTKWLYELAVNLWESWLPGQSANILKGGFYSYNVNPNLKIVGLNTMFCYNYNFWLWHTTFDPAGELVWLANELLAAEQAGQKVHILSHIPGNSDCISVWGNQYRKIVDRFENTLVGQFHGHTHNDHYLIYFDPADSERATNVAFIGGSGTAYSDVNPNYRIYTVDGPYDGASYRVLDHETWYYNLTEANLGGELVPPNWQKLYTFTEAYGVPSALPQDTYDLVLRMINDPQLLQLYFSYYVKLGDTSLAEGCDDACARKELCKILTSVETDYSKCDQLLPPLP
ncbi:sphingomyelin phosphodiesterase-like [Neocloeon triangulifer]|uniref:sphingomyelin phosphodiesterase-like n=1 Tax=Neocloeon triangulifer TaxID=2078957 RepID=UPI00286F709E|nr:sphingomyelin phosphodiesterase-like [Neocloeon triangulifer]